MATKTNPHSPYTKSGKMDKRMTWTNKPKKTTPKKKK